MHVQLRANARARVRRICVSFVSALLYGTAYPQHQQQHWYMLVGPNRVIRAGSVAQVGGISPFIVSGLSVVVFCFVICTMGHPAYAAAFLKCCSAAPVDGLRILVKT